ncbi:MAG: AEC family transporter [Firmicutes bacterium]|nr:AEC family transporter [Bacillota bacterium]
MQKLLTMQFTLFVLIAVGLLLSRIGVIGREGRKNLTDLVLYLILPCNIVGAFQNDSAAHDIMACLYVFLISCGIQAVTVVYGKIAYRNQPDAHQRSLRYGLICSNAGFLGNPIAEGLYGAEGLVLANFYLIPQRVMMWSAGISIYAGEKDPKTAVKKVLTHPCVIACEIGLILMLLNIQLPALILTPVNTIGRCNTAVSMLVIGSILADINPKDFLDKVVVRYALERLVFLPLLVYLVCRLIGFSHIVTGLSVILAAMPAGATTSMLAQKYDQDPKFATKLTIFSTLLSIPSVFIWSLILG